MLNTFYTLRTQFISLIVAVCVCVKSVSLILYARITSLSLRVSVSTAGFACLRLNRRLCASPFRPSVLCVSVSTVGFVCLRLVCLRLDRRIYASPSRPSAFRVSVSTVGFVRLSLDRRFCASLSWPSALRIPVSTVGFAHLCLERRLCATPSRPSTLRVSVSAVGFARFRLDRRLCASLFILLGSCVTEFLILSKRHRISYPVNSFPTIFSHLFILSFFSAINLFFLLFVFCFFPTNFSLQAWSFLCKYENIYSTQINIKSTHSPYHGVQHFPFGCHRQPIEQRCMCC